MLRKIRISDMDWLAEPDDPQAVIDLLGTPLAAYMLQPKWRELTGLATPTPPEGSVCCLLVLEKQNFPGVMFEYLATSFILPLQWQQGEHDSPALPQDIRNMASKVRQDLGISGWCIDFVESLRYLDLSDWPLEAQSIWAPMAAGLYLAHSGARSKPWIFATGRWTKQGMKQIGSVKEKIQAIQNIARSNNNNQTIHVFVPSMNYGEAKEYAPSSWQIHDYPQTETQPRNTLLTHLKTLDLPPSSSAPLEDRLAYSNRQHIVQDTTLRQTYFLRHLVDDIADGLANKLKTPIHPHHSDKRFVFPQKLALAVSFSYDVAVLLIKTFRPQEVLLMYTEETQQYLKNLKDEVQDCLSEDAIKPLLFSLEHAPSFIQQCREWLSTPANTTRAVEITGGTKYMSLALLKAAQLANTDVLYVKHDTTSGKPRYGSEDIVKLDWATS